MLLLYALARPILSGTAPSSAGNSTVFDPVTGECDDIHGCRTGSQILWNCLSVIFICTWVAIHPNVPHVEAHRAVVLFCNGMLMAIAMLAPEIIILWAIRQRYSAKDIARRFEKYGWGAAHGFLVIMGGFALYDDDKFCGYIWNNGSIRWYDPSGVQGTVRHEIQVYHRTVKKATAELDKRHGEKHRDNPSGDVVPDSTDETRLIANSVPGSTDDLHSQNLDLTENLDLLEFLVKSGYIKITEDEIMDNLSHSDSITKIIAVVQTAWFLLQVGARAMEGLAITELEIITVGFAVLNFGTYFLWWNKPLRVRHPVRVYWRQQEPVAKGGKEKSDGKGWMDKTQKFFVGVSESIREAFIDMWNAMVVLVNFLVESDLNNNSLPDANWVTLLQLVGLLFLVVFRLIIASISIIADDDDDYMAYVVNFSRLKKESFTLYILVYGLTTLFGAIHCIPWNFQFPTDREQLLWRISAGGLVVLPIGLAVVLGPIWVIGKVVEWCGGDAEDLIGVLGTLLDFILLPLAYIVARITLMVLALAELRSLPQSAYQTVQWTTFIPHIG